MQRCGEFQGTEEDSQHEAPAWGNGAESKTHVCGIVEAKVLV